MLPGERHGWSATAEVNVGIAVALPDGLPVPVIAHADELELDAIARAAQGSGGACPRAASCGRRIWQGGTFTISNLGMYGVDAFLPSSMRRRSRFCR